MLCLCPSNTWPRPRLVLGLPGNPVSAMVTAHLYVVMSQYEC